MFSKTCPSRFVLYFNIMDIDIKHPAIGIAAEYNPFHNGHALHIDRARAYLSDLAPVVAVLSSSFTQRGLPVMADKWTRARAALENGVDLVLELPFFYACNAGPEFARGAVDILAAAKIVTHLSFGMETPFPQTPKSKKENSTAPNVSILEKSAFDTIVDILIHEPLSFKLSVKKNLASGKSYSRSVAEALDQELPESGNFISKPNNSLALSYILRIQEKNHALIPLAVKRDGAGYHDEAKGPLASAAAIRSALENGLWEDTWAAAAMPETTFTLLREERKRGRLCLGTEKLWSLLRCLFSRTSPEELRRCAGMDEGLENLFLRHYTSAASYEDFIGRCVCARYTRGRLQRQAIRCLTGLDRWTALALSRGNPPYIRVLGFNERGRVLLRERRKLTRGAEDIPAITRLAALSSAKSRAMAELEFRASRLRELLLPCPDLAYEERQKPVTPRERLKI
jgi:predicted nucleotidyltransferase